MNINISYYTATVFMCTFALLTLSIGISGNHNLDTKTRDRFQFLFFMIAFLNWAEWLCTHLNGSTADFRILHIIMQYLEFVLTPLLPIAAIRIMINKNCSHVFTIPFHFNLVLQTVSLFNGCVFTVNENNEYSRGILYPLYALIFVFSVCVLFYQAYRYSEKYQFANLSFFSMLIAMLAIAFVSSVWISYLKIDWSCTSITAILFYVYHRQLEHQVDNVTTLLNRKCFDHDLSVLNCDAAIAFFDVDSFKNVNDTYGHGFADECLNKLGSEMKRIFESKGYCYRYGGDEACVIIRKNIDKAEKYIQSYIDCIDELRADDPRIPSVSAGYAYFNPAVERPDDAVKRADEMMYHNKANLRK